MRCTSLPLCLLCLGLLLSAAWSDEQKPQEKKPRPGDAAGQLFERLKALSGEWVLAKESALGPKGKVVVRYRLTAGHSAVVETIFRNSSAVCSNFVG